MSGKAYTMREMKAIIEYLTEHRAYGEIRGRKMWMNYANSKFTTRTWQSLKETFLKRILPDITNPYYKLTVEQIASFQQGTDLEAKINNKLDIQTIDDSSDDNHKKDPQPSNSNNTKGGSDAGEDILCSEINQIRSSTDTVVIEPCYNTAEEIQKELESPSRGNENTSAIPCSTKSIRDYITYSEPLTPMLQEVLHDFASDDEGDEPQMQIVEYPEPSKGNGTTSPNEMVGTEKTVCENEKNEDIDNKIDKDKCSKKDSMANKLNEDVLLEENVNDSAKKCDNMEDIQNSDEKTANTTDVSPNNTLNVSKNSDDKTPQLSLSQNNAESIVDTLPNNPEALKKMRETSENNLDKQDANDLSSTVFKNDSRKRSKSNEIDNIIPEKKHCTDKTRERSSSDRDTIAPCKLSNTELAPKENMSEIKCQSNSEHEKKIYHNIAEPNNPQRVISEEQETQAANKQCESSICISEDSSSKKQQLPDVSIKTDEDEASLVSVTKRDTRGASNKKNENPGSIKEVINDVVILKSHSESTSDHVMISPKKNKASLRDTQNVHRDRALANVFGFSRGIKSNRKQQKKNMKRKSSHQRQINTSSSDDWTSDTGTEFVSPPRGHKNKHSRKYLKPKSARILTLEEEGGLFVMYGKKIYPVVKDGKLVKNYVTYTPDKDSEDDESYWKLKYVEEKKKTDELTKLLKHNKKKKSASVGSDEFLVPQATECEDSKPAKDPSTIAIEKSVEPEKKMPATESKTVKIQFMKDNESVQVEGHWTHIQPVLEQVVQILHKEPEPREIPPPPEKTSVEREVDPPQGARSARQTPVTKQKVSGSSTPISTIQLDEDVTEKLDKIEEEIYQTIQERDLAEKLQEDVAFSNVTKRKAGRPRQSSLTANKPDGTPEPAKRKTSLRPTDEERNDSTVVTRRQARTPRKTNEKEPVITEAKRTTRRTSRNAAMAEGDSSTKYKFRSQPHPEYTTDNKTKSPRKTATRQTTKRRYSFDATRVFSSPDYISMKSVDSSQGYQESDGNNLSICLRKKRKLSLTVLNRGRAKTQRVLKRHYQPYTREYLSSDSNGSFVTAPLKSSSYRSSSVNTEVYRSDSYQMLFPRKQNAILPLDKIEEKNSVVELNSLKKIDVTDPEVIGKKGSLLVNENNNIISPSFADYGENSSNVTLPPSPVLSIVEKISLSKSVLENTKDIDIPGDNHEAAKQTMLNDYMITDIDMSVPLMEQDRGLRKNVNDEIDCRFNFNLPEKFQEISDSLLNKVCAVNIAEPTLSESIHHKLKNLFLESAKKLAKEMNENKDNANEMEISEMSKQRKSAAKKRCSTPRKRQRKQNAKAPNVEPNIVEEHVESCEIEKPGPPPPMLIVTAVGQNEKVPIDVDGEKPQQIKKKKDVIKVKISKPKMKKKGYGSSETLIKQAKISRQSDSGINDTESGVFLRGLEDSIDLIHNHSDTCLQAHECIEESVEIIDDNAMPAISLNSSSVSIKCASVTASIGDRLLDICCENAQDAENQYTGTDTSRHAWNEDSYIFKSPTANISPVNSLLTDDLSDENSLHNNREQNRISKWYLLSEDEATNTRNVDEFASISNANSSCGANLLEIFPITCAVPDLSTITEENTAKFVIDRNTKSEFDPQTLPNA